MFEEQSNDLNITNPKQMGVSQEDSTYRIGDTGKGSDELVHQRSVALTFADLKHII